MNNDRLRPVFLSKEQRLARKEAPPLEAPAERAAKPEHATSQGSLTDAEKSLIRAKYLGESLSKQTRQEKHDRKIRFAWDDTEDTTDSARPAAIPARASAKGPASERLLHGSQHWSKKALKDMDSRDWRIFREDFNIRVQGNNAPNPLRSWLEAELDFILVDNLQSMGLSRPTPIQMQAIPAVLSRRDLLAVADTGSGKTIAYLAPIASIIRKMPAITQRNALDGPYSLILAPTRELSLQIQSEAARLCRGSGVRVVPLIGGSFKLRDGVEIIIATPGRLRDCIEQHVLSLNQCHLVILDEADKMIDLDFEDDLQFILQCIPHTDRQLSFFTATMPPPVEKLVRSFAKTPVTVRIEDSSISDQISQQIKMTTPERKMSDLLDILCSGRFDAPILIFVNQKSTTEMLERKLSAARVGQLVTLHGGKTQSQREKALAEFRSGERQILVATDLAGRGIDVKNISLVINYDMPMKIETYIHRIGRTGRAGSTGTAVTLLTNEDSALFPELRAFLKKTGGHVPPDLDSADDHRAIIN